MRFDTNSLTILNDDGSVIGHVIDAIRSGLADASEAKSLLDRAWIAREEVHAAQVASANAQIVEINRVHEDAIARFEAERQSSIDKLQKELDDCRKEYVAGNMDHG